MWQSGLQIEDVTDSPENNLSQSTELCLDQVDELNEAQPENCNVKQVELKPLPVDSESPVVLVPLYDYPEFTYQCAVLINNEWKRSVSSRLNILWSCNKRFPVAMVLVKHEGRKVVGHCKISRLPNFPQACFVETVVIHPDMRGQGLGSYLMTKLEDYVKSRKLNTIYLSTLGQEKFYMKLGYEECEPVSLYSFSQSKLLSKKEEISLLSTEAKPDESVQTADTQPVEKILIDCPLISASKKVDLNEKNTGEEDYKLNKFSLIGKVSDRVNYKAPAPPPPPMPVKPLCAKACKTYMKKEIVG